MQKLATLLILSLFALTACHTPSKEDRYNAMSPSELYRQGTKNALKSHFLEAVEDFEALESRYPFGEYADKAQLGAIYSLYKNEDYPAALPAVERFIRMYPRHPDVDYAYYMKGLVHYMEALGYLGKYIPLDRAERDATPAKKALQSFYVLTTMFPASAYTPDAKLRMVYLRNMLAAHELAAARFYIKKGAYLAAATRGDYVVRHFDRTPSLPEALAIMVEAYRALELPELANDAYRVLVLNYPQSPFIEKLG